MENLYYQSAKKYSLKSSVDQFEQMLNEEIEDNQNCLKDGKKQKLNFLPFF